MQLTYDELSDAVYIRLATESVARSERLGPRTVVDYDHDGSPVGVELLEASEGISLGHGFTAPSHPEVIFRALYLVGRRTAFQVSLPGWYFDPRLPYASYLHDFQGSWIAEASGDYRLVVSEGKGKSKDKAPKSPVPGARKRARPVRP